MYKNIIIILAVFWIAMIQADDSSTDRSYLQIKSQVDQKVNKIEYENIFMSDPNSFSGQSALLDLGKIELLERNYDQALHYFKKIFHNDITVKEYWIAKCYLLKGEPDSAIISAQNYIYSALDNNKIETSYFIIAEAYIDKGLFTKALNTLNYLKNSENIQNNIPLLHYKMGFCNEKLGNYEKALTYYKKLKLDFPYHEYTYLAEDRIYKLSSENKIEIDLKDVLINDNEKVPDDSDNLPDKEMKKFLQVGAFSKKKNAEKHAEDINKSFTGSYIVFEKDSNGKTLFIVAFGPYETSKLLNDAKEALLKKGYSSFEIKRSR